MKRHKNYVFMKGWLGLAATIEVKISFSVRKAADISGLTKTKTFKWISRPWTILRLKESYKAKFSAETITAHLVLLPPVLPPDPVPLLDSGRRALEPHHLVIFFCSKKKKKPYKSAFPPTTGCQFCNTFTMNWDATSPTVDLLQNIRSMKESKKQHAFSQKYFWSQDIMKKKKRTEMKQMSV